MRRLDVPKIFMCLSKTYCGALVKSGENANDDSRVYIVCAQDSENEFLSKCRPGARIKKCGGQKGDQHGGTYFIQPGQDS